jgi:ABC-2 type transport system ATP-binding protein
MSRLIQFSNLTLIYNSKTIIKDLTFSVDEGEIFGLVGKNGAGKSTVIRVMSTLLEPTYGEVLINGYSVTNKPEVIRKIIGYVPDQSGLYSNLTSWEYLDFFGACYKIPIHERVELISTLLELVELYKQKDAWIEELSLGMKQRLKLARALLHDPKVLILDDPLSRLDFYEREEIIELLRELAKLGKTIFFSSHILADISRLCNRAGIIDSGQLIAQGSVQELENFDSGLASVNEGNLN